MQGAPVNQMIYMHKGEVKLTSSFNSICENISNLSVHKWLYRPVTSLLVFFNFLLEEGLLSILLLRKEQ